MDIGKIILGGLLMIVGQITSFFQLQGAIKYGWYEKYMWLILLSSVLSSYIYIKSVNFFVEGFGGQIWPSRLIGFAIGIIVFTLLSTFLFKEHMTAKTIISIILALSIVGVQLFWK